MPEILGELLPLDVVYNLKVAVARADKLGKGF